jgi:hypothetical protein
LPDEIMNDAFGSVEFPEGENPFAATEASEPEPEVEVEVEEGTEVTVTPQEGETEIEVTEPETKEELPTTAEAAEQLLAGKYKNVDDLVNAHQHLDAWTTRTRQENIDLQRQLEQYKAAVQRIVPYLEQQQQQVPEEIDYSDPQAVQALIRQQVEEGIKQHIAPIQDNVTRAQEEAAHQAKQQEFQRWQQDNPEVQPGTPMWTAMNNVVYELQFDPEENKLVEDNFPLTPQNLSIAKELATDSTLHQMASKLKFVPSDSEDIQLLRDAAENPNLADLLEAVPDLLMSSKGHEVARRQAGLPAVVSQAQANAQAAQKASAEAQRKAAYVVSDTAGAPAQAAPGQRPDEAWEAIGGPLWEKEKSQLI